MKDIAVLFWERVDALSKSRSLKEFAYSVDVNYTLLLNWRTKKRLPALEQACRIAKVLGTTVEFLITGRDPEIPSAHLRDIVRKLETSSEFDLELVRRVLRLLPSGDENNK